MSKKLVNATIGLAMVLTGIVQAQDNVLLIIADDLGVDRVAAYAEHPTPGKTPVLDGLASRGLLFRNAYSNPVCSPTRMTILAGRYAFRTGIGAGMPWDDPDSVHGQFVANSAEVTIPEVLTATHRTAAIGKWHLSTFSEGLGHLHPIAVGFDAYLGNPRGLLDDYSDWERTVATQAGHWEAQDKHYATSTAVDDALTAITRFGEDPWFVWLAFNAPHYPYHWPPAALHSFSTFGWPINKAKQHKAMTEAMDTEIGRLLASIPPSVLARTHIIFVGDNGTPGVVVTRPFQPDHAKATLYEGGVNVPLIITGPAVVQPGREVDALVNTTDLFATIIELAGAHVPEAAVDSVSLVPYLENDREAPRRSWAFAEWFTPNGLGPTVEDHRMLRDGRYKLIRRQGGALPPLEFYDLREDPFEQVNLWPDLSPDQGAAFESLGAALDELH